MATAGSIIVDLLARTGSFITDMDRARKKVTEFDNDLKGMIARLDRASVAIAGVAAAAAGGWVALTMQTVKAMDATAKMAQQIGVTTESLTSLRFAAQQFANVSDQTFDMALRRMTRRIEEAAQGSGGAKAAFEAMGLSAKELARLSPDQQFMRIADAMQKTDTQAQRLKNTMAIFDTEGMPLVNALSQGSKELERNIELATRYGVVLSTEAARSAEQLTDNLSRLSSIQDGLRQQLTTAMLPALERLSGYMLGVAESALEVGNSRHRLEEFSRVAVEFVDDLARSYAGLTVIGRGVLDMLAELDEAALGWLEPFKVETVAATTILTQSFSESILNTAREIDMLVGLAGGVMAVWETVGNNIPLYFRVAWNKVLEGAATFVNSLSDLVNPMLEALGMDGFGKVAWGENVVVGLRSISESFREGYESAKAASGMAERVQAAFDGVAVSAAGAATATGDNTGSLNSNRRASEAARKAAEAFRKEQERALVAHYQSISAIHAQAQGIEDQVALFGQSKSALEDLTIARLEEEAVVLRMYGDRSKAAVEAIEAEIEARKRLRTAIGSLEQKEAEKAAWQSWAQDVKTIFDQVGQSLTDAIFDGGKSGLDLLKDWAKTLTLRVVIQPMLSGLQGMVTNQLGGMLGFSDPRQGGGVLGTAQNLYSGYNAITGGLNSTLGNAAQWMGQKIGSEALTSFGLGLSGTTAATGIASIGAGLGASLGTSIGTSAAAMTSTTFAASMTGGAVIPGLGVGVAGGGVGAGIGAAGAAAGGAAAGGAAGFGAAFGAALPWIGGALAIGGLLGGGLFDREPTTRRGQRARVDFMGGRYGVTSTDDRQPGAEAAIRQMAQQAVESANALMRQTGVDAAIDTFYALTESSIKGDRQGVGSGGTLRLGDRLIDFGLREASDMTLGGFGGWSEAEMLPRLATDIQLSVLEAFQSVGDQLPSVLSAMLEGIDVRSLGEQEAQALAERFTMLTQGASQFLAAIDAMPFAELRDLTFDAAAGMVQFAGGLDNLLTAQQTYFENFYSEAERHEYAIGQITQALSSVGVEMPAITGSVDEMKAAYRALVESQDLNTEAGQQAYVVLMQNAGAFAEVATYAGTAAEAVRSAADIAKERERLERQWLSLVGDMAELRRRDLELLDESNRALQEMIWARQEELDAITRTATSLQSAEQAMLTIGQLADRIGSTLGLDAVFSQRREQELWNAIGSGTLEQQAEMARELTDIVMSRVSAEQQANRERLTVLRQELTTYRNLQSIGASLQNYLRSLESSALAPYTLGEKVGNAEAELARLVQAARGGDESALRQVQGALQNALTLWRDYGASGAEYQDAYHRLTGMVGDLAGRAVSEAEAQLMQLELQVESLENISGLSEANLAQLRQLYDITSAAADAAYEQYQLEMAAADDQLQQLHVMGLDTARLHDIADLLQQLPASIAAQLQTGTMGYLSANPDVMGAFEQSGGGNASAFALQHYYDYGMLEGREFNGTRGEKYLLANSDVLAAFLQDDGGMSADEYARFHYEQYGKFEGRSFAVGTPYVTHDQLANIHRGEIIIDPRSSDILRRYGIQVQGQGGDAAEMKALRQELTRLTQVVERIGQAQVTATHQAAERSADKITAGVSDAVTRRTRDDANQARYKRAGAFA